MFDDVKILNARRSFEFRVDELRLTALSVPMVQQQIQQKFQFQRAGIGTPVETFGAVPSTIPPGIVFDMGGWSSPDGQLIPIRFIHFEQQRIVIDVAGPSSFTGLIFEDLTQFLSPLKLADNSAVIGEALTFLDYSEISAKASFPLDALLIPGISDVFKQGLGLSSNEGLELIPSFSVQVNPNNQVFPGVVPSSQGFLQFTLRAGSEPNQKLYFSAAPVDSDTHLEYLNRLEGFINAGKQM